MFAGPTSQRVFLQSATSSATNKPAFFPPGAVDGYGDYFSEYLRSIGEPSLFAATKDRSAVSYRLVWLSGQKGYLLAVRLALNFDESASLIATEEFGTKAPPARTERSLSGADVRKFLELVEKAEFWSMPSVEEEKSKSSRKSYRLDASTWVFEGVRNGSYRVILRRAPEPSSFTEMVRFLTRDLAKLDESASPHPSPGGRPSL
ncbi:MAG: hypothetical protein WBP79_13020 [Candidatus Acidiferrales bacterium]